MQTNQTIPEFLVNQGDYSNPAGVKFFVDQDMSLSVYGDVVEIPASNVCLEYSLEVDSVEEFMEVFQISKVDQVIHLKSEDLFSAYLKGKIKIICELDDDFASGLAFHKIEDKTFAENDENELHEVKRNLKEPYEFIEYTSAYYRVNGVLI